MFVSWIKYKKLADNRNHIFITNEEEIHRLKMELKEKDKQIEEYKRLYIDELTKSLFLAEQVRLLEMCVSTRTPQNDEVRE